MPTPTGTGRNAPPSNEDIARVAVGALLDPHRHDGRAYRPTGPALLSGPEIADALGEALGRRVRHIDIPPWMFMRAVRVNAKRLGADMFFESSLRRYLPEYALGTFEVGGPTTHVADVTGVEPEDFLTIARRYVTGPESRRTAVNLVRQVWNFMLTELCTDAPAGRFRPSPAASSTRTSPAFGPIRGVAKRAHSDERIRKDCSTMSTKPSAEGAAAPMSWATRTWRCSGCSCRDGCMTTTPSTRCGSPGYDRACGCSTWDAGQVTCHSSPPGWSAQREPFSVSTPHPRWSRWHAPAPPNKA